MKNPHCLHFALNANDGVFDQEVVKTQYGEKAHGGNFHKGMERKIE